MGILIANRIGPTVWDFQSVFHDPNRSRTDKTEKNMIPDPHIYTSMSNKQKNQTLSKRPKNL